MDQPRAPQSTFTQRSRAAVLAALEPYHFADGTYSKMLANETLKVLRDEVAGSSLRLTKLAAQKYEARQTLQSLGVVDPEASVGDLAYKAGIVQGRLAAADELNLPITVWLDAVAAQRPAPPTNLAHRVLSRPLGLARRAAQRVGRETGISSSDSSRLMWQTKTMRSFVSKVLDGTVAEFRPGIENYLPSRVARANEVNQRFIDGTTEGRKAYLAKVTDAMQDVLTGFDGRRPLSENEYVTAAERVAIDFGQGRARQTSRPEAKTDGLIMARYFQALEFHTSADAMRRIADELPAVKIVIAALKSFVTAEMAAVSFAADLDKFVAHGLKSGGRDRIELAEQALRARDRLGVTSPTYTLGDPVEVMQASRNGRLDLGSIANGDIQPNLVRSNGGLTRM